MGEKRTMNFTLHNDNPVDVSCSLFVLSVLERQALTLLFSL